MAYRVLHSRDAFWRPSNLMKVENTNLATQLEAAGLGFRLWRLRPGQASTRHKHLEEEEIYLVLEGTGRMRVGDEALTLEPLSAVLVEPGTVRQVFNDTDEDALWLVAGAPPEGPRILAMDERELQQIYPEGPRVLPPELGGGEFDPEKG
jgi:quercetin dioxygenase-like cupin family protein